MDQENHTWPHFAKEGNGDTKSEMIQEGVGLYGLGLQVRVFCFFLQIHVTKIMTGGH